MQSTTPVIFEEVKPSIFIPSAVSNASYNLEMTAIFERIHQNPIGLRLLNKIHSKNIKVIVTPGVNYYTRTVDSVPIIELSFNINEHSHCYNPLGELIPSPQHVALFHQFVSAYHLILNKPSLLTDPIAWHSSLQYKVVIGYPSKKGRMTPKVTENAFRRAENLPDRFGHWSTDCKIAHEFFMTRIRSLGRIYQSHQGAEPPPVIHFSLKDIDACNNLLLIAKIYENGHNINRLKIFESDERFDSLLNNCCYHEFDTQNSQRMLPLIFPNKESFSYILHSLTIVRITEAEMKIFQSLTN